MRALIRALSLALLLAGLVPRDAGAGALPVQDAGGAGGTRDVPLMARISKPNGAAIRTMPTSRAPIAFSAACGETFPVTVRGDSWVKIASERGEGWVSTERIHLAGYPREVDCSSARLLVPGTEVTIDAPSECVPLRAAPASYAIVRACLEHGHALTVVDGPDDRDSREDWFEVTSPSAGSGWVLADQLAIP